MPIYEYRCDACGHELDALQKLSDEPLRDCPECKAAALRRLMSAPSFRLKGGGWYETDFKSDKEKKRNLAGDGATGDGKAEKPPSGEAGSADKTGPEPKKKDVAQKTGETAKKDSGASAV